MLISCRCILGPWCNSHISIDWQSVCKFLDWTTGFGNLPHLYRWWKRPLYYRRCPPLSCYMCQQTLLLQLSSVLRHRFLKSRSCNLQNSLLRPLANLKISTPLIEVTASEPVREFHSLRTHRAAYRRCTNPAAYQSLHSVFHHRRFMSSISKYSEIAQNNAWKVATTWGDENIDRKCMEQKVTRAWS